MEMYTKGVSARMICMGKELSDIITETFSRANGRQAKSRGGASSEGQMGIYK